MRRYFALILTLLVGLYGSVALADTTTTARPTDKQATPLRGTLYRIDHQGHSAWLFGTVHIGHAAFYPLEPQVTRALHQADTLVIEVDIRNQSALQTALREHAFYRDGDDLAQHVAPTTLQQLKESLLQAGIPFEAVGKMKPWMVANLMIIQAMAQNGYPTEQGIEQYFLTIAAKENKTVQELETADYQLSLFNKMPPAQQEAYLLETLRDLKDGSGIKKGIRLIEAWSRADSEAMSNLQREMLKENATSAHFIENILLNERNPGMAESIETLLKDRQKIFVAVGALHLIGDNSVPALLKQRGYRITKLY